MKNEVVFRERCRNGEESEFRSARPGKDCNVSGSPYDVSREILVVCSLLDPYSVRTFNAKRSRLILELG